MRFYLTVIAGCVLLVMLSVTAVVVNQAFRTIVQPELTVCAPKT